MFIVLASIATFMIGSLVGALFSLATLLPSIAAATRRLHGTNRSGWWQFICLVPVIGIIILIVFLAQEGKADVSEASA